MCHLEWVALSAKKRKLHECDINIVYKKCLTSWKGNWWMIANVQYAKAYSKKAITWYSGGFSWRQKNMHVKYVIQIIYLCQLI